MKRERSSDPSRARRRAAYLAPTVSVRPCPRRALKIKLLEIEEDQWPGCEAAGKLSLRFRIESR
jgi:hypothetical protein